VRVIHLEAHINNFAKQTDTQLTPKGGKHSRSSKTMEYYAKYIKTRHYESTYPQVQE